MEPDGPSFLMRVTNDEADAIHVERRKARDRKVAAWRLKQLTNLTTKGELREWSQLDPGSRLRWRISYDDFHGGRSA